MADFLIEFLENEVHAGRLPCKLPPIQSGVGSVANAVLGGLQNSNFRNLSLYSEVLQDSVLDLIETERISLLPAQHLRSRLSALVPFIKVLNGINIRLSFDRWRLVIP